MFEHKCSEEDFKICLNSNKCHLCDGKKLLRLPKWMVQEQRKAERIKKRIPKKTKEGMSFEKSVTSKFNSRRKSSSKDINAKRRPNSGALWNMPGDIVTKEQLIECKERGTTNARGELQITIHKNQLSKIQQEAFLSNKKTWYFLFKFKEASEIYLIKDFEDELDLLDQINILKERVKELEGRED